MTTIVSLLLLISTAADYPLAVHLIQSNDGDRAALLIACENRTFEDIGDLTLVFKTAVSEQVISMASIPANGVETASIEMPIGAIVVASYTWREGRRSQAFTIGSETLARASTYSTLWPAALTLVGTLFGAYLVHVFTDRREKRKLAVEWSETMFLRYEDEFRLFLNAARAPTSAASIREHWKRLREKAFVPPELARQVDLRLDALVSSNDSVDVTRLKGLEIALQVQSYVDAPWVYGRVPRG